VRACMHACVRAFMCLLLPSDVSEFDVFSGGSANVVWPPSPLSSSLSPRMHLPSSSSSTDSQLQQQIVASPQPSECASVS